MQFSKMEEKEADNTFLGVTQGKKIFLGKNELMAPHDTGSTYGEARDAI